MCRQVARTSEAAPKVSAAALVGAVTLSQALKVLSLLALLVKVQIVIPEELQDLNSDHQTASAALGSAFFSLLLHASQLEPEKNPNRALIELSYSLHTAFIQPE